MKRVSKAKLNQGIGQEEELKVNPYLVRRLRHAMANFKRPKFRAKTVAAFVLLPQFRMCFEGFTHLYPAFLRMVATLFAEVNLIPPTHPVMTEGSPESRRYSFRKLMGEVWFRLKTARASAYQWSIFGAVVMMITAVAASAGALFTRIIMGVGSVAQAQMFNVFQNTSDPYGTGEDPSCATAIGGCSGVAGTQGITGAAGLFDLRVQGNNISADYALMLLDKILRQGMANTPNGGSMQNALGDLMQIYNTGMLIVACVMIGWMVTSLIIDTAKTGTVGGGRHNIAWVPIRVLFALGIMFPLGSVGFSGGQYMVVKLAEWGSNFGSQGWQTYVASVIGNRAMLAPYSVNNATNIVNGLTKIMVCQVAYNTYLLQRTGSLDPDQVIERKQEGVNSLGRTSQLYITNRYTNNSDSNICGSVKYGSNTGPDDMTDILNYNPAAPMTPSSPSSPLGTAPDNVTRSATMATAVGTFRTRMRNALEPILQDTQVGLATDGGTAIQAARAFACDFVARRFSDGDLAVPGGAGNPVAGVPQCNGTAAAAIDPDASALQAIHTDIQAQMMSAFTGAGGARASLEAYIGNGAPGPMITEMSARGWAGMALWYKDISIMNNVMLGAKEPVASIDPGSMWIGGNSQGWERCAGDNNESGEQCKMSGIQEKTFSILNDYDRWWTVSSKVTADGKAAAPATANANAEMGSSTTSGISSILSWLNNITMGDNSILSVLMRFIFPRTYGVFLFDAVDLAATNTYPLAQLAEVGHSVLGIGITLWGAVSILQAVSTIEGIGFSLGKGLAFSALMNLIAAAGSSMILAGLMISFYLPALPFIRVGFAVLTWMVSVFEAVVMVPVAALTHLSTTGPGLMGNYGRAAWTLWFNVFMRPILVVFGFVAGMLIYNSFAVYFHTIFSQGAMAIMEAHWWPMAILAKVCYSVIYLATLYSAANMAFKLLDTFPNALMRWLGDWGARADVSMNQNNIGAGMGFAGAKLIDQLKNDIPMSGLWSQPRIITKDDREAILARASSMGASSSNMSTNTIQQVAKDKALTLMRMRADDKDRYNAMSQRDKDRFLQHMFLQQENERFKRFGLERGIGFSLTGGQRDKWSVGNMWKHGAAGILATRLQGEIMHDGRTWHKDNKQGFIALDGEPGLGRGQLAGVSVTDKMLDKAIEHSNRTRTSHWDEMSEGQRTAVQRKIESMMSNADALNYVGMDSESKMEFLQSMYLSDPELFAPGIGDAGMEEMLEILKNPEKLKDGDTAERAGMMRTWMSKDEKAWLTNAYLKWETQQGRGGFGMGAGAGMGNLAAAAMTDKMLDKALGDESRHAAGEMGDASRNKTQALYAQMNAEEATAYEQLSISRKAGFEKTIEDKAKLEADYKSGKIEQEEYRQRLIDIRRMLSSTYGVNYVGGVVPPL